MVRIRATAAAFTVSFALVGTLACSVSTPLTPAPPQSGSGAAADGSTLKVGAPTLVSPINDTVITTQKPTLSIAKATGQFSATTVFQYEFELQTDAGSVLVRGTVSGTDFTVPDNLVVNSAFRWRARAVLNGGVGPFSPTGRFQSPKVQNPTASSSNDDWKNWFFQLIVLRGVGPTLTVQALLALDPDFVAVGVIQETDSARNPRGRLYLPNNSGDKFARSVDLGTFGGPWQWLPRGGTTCEGGSCK